jgi:hypothetical protein
MVFLNRQEVKHVKKKDKKLVRIPKENFIQQED